MDMSDTLYDLPSWSLDPFDEALRLPAHPSASADEQLLATMPMSPFNLSWDQLDSHLAHELGDNTDPSPAKSAGYSYSYNYPDRPRFPDAKNTLLLDDFVPDLDELLRSTSQLATERALYMTVGSPSSSTTTTTSSAMSMSMPLLDACSPGSSHLSSGASDAEAEPDADWDRDLSAVYRLPDGASAFSTPFYPQQLQRQQHQEHAADPGLTPLEMPDGTTRFTSNWLPVDPEGGFTIHAASAAATATATGFSPCPLEYPDCAPEAFISVGRRVSATGG